MPFDTWAHQPTVTRHDRGWSVPVAVTEVDVETDDGPATAWAGIRLETAGLTIADVRHAITADPDATEAHQAEAVALCVAASGFEPAPTGTAVAARQGGVSVPLSEQVGILLAQVFPPDPEPGPGADPAGFPGFSGVWHAGTILNEDGKLWRNTSGTLLTVPPSGMPLHNGHLYVEVGGEGPVWPQWKGPWAATTEYSMGDHADEDGAVYRSLAVSMGQRPSQNPDVWEKVA